MFCKYVSVTSGKRQERVEQNDQYNQTARTCITESLKITIFEQLVDDSFDMPSLDSYPYDKGAIYGRYGLDPGGFDESDFDVASQQVGPCVPGVTINVIAIPAK